MRARRVFEDLAMERTRRGNAVLVYIAVESRAFAIVFDHGISDVVPTRMLVQSRRELETAIASHGLIEGVAMGLVRVSHDLGRYFPCQEDDTNELEDSVSLAW